MDALLETHPDQPKTAINHPAELLGGVFPSQTWHKWNVQREHKFKEKKTKIKQTRGEKPHLGAKKIILTTINSGREPKNPSWLRLCYFA